jgi:hypothetical protein
LPSSLVAVVVTWRIVADNAVADGGCTRDTNAVASVV